MCQFMNQASLGTRLLMNKGYELYILYIFSRFEIILTQNTHHESFFPSALLKLQVLR